MTTSSATAARAFPWAVVIICGLAVAFDAYDLVAYGATLTDIRDEWGLSGTQSGLLGSLALVGTLIGSIFVGTLASVFPRRTVFMACLAWFSVFTVACAFATGPVIFGVLRFISGFGLGGLIPLAAAITQSVSPPARRNMIYVIMQSGFPLGGVLASLVAMAVIPDFGWRSVYLFAGLPLITILPAAWFLLPRDEETRQAPRPTAQRTDGTAGQLRQAAAALFAPGLRRSTVLLWSLMFCALLVVYGANTWIPSLMGSRGFGGSTALWFLFAFNAGAIVGGVAAGWLADRFSMKPVVVLSFLVGAAAVLSFTAINSGSVLMACATVAGYGAVGTQTMVNSWATASYPDWLKTTGVGWALGVGRLGAIVGPYAVGWLVAAGIGEQGPFLLFAGMAVLGAVFASLMVARKPAETDTVLHVGPEASPDSVPEATSAVVEG